MLIACWSVKGGAGTTVVAGSLSLLLARHAATGAVFVDLTGDGPGVLGLAEPTQPGLAGWLQAGEDVPVDALTRLEVDAGPGLSLLPRGRGPLAADRAEALAKVLDRSRRPTVVDCGNLARVRAHPVRTEVARVAARSLLVIRPCALAFRHAAEQATVRATGAVVIGGGTGLGRQDVERVLGVPTVARIHDDPAVAHAVNAGLLAGKLPRALVKGLRDVI